MATNPSRPSVVNAFTGLFTPHESTLVLTKVVMATNNSCVMDNQIPSSSAPDETIAPRELRDALAHFATGVTVITGTAIGGYCPVGMAVNSFASVSLEPPLVLFCAAETSTTWPHIRASGAFCANVLTADQHELALRFAAKNTDRFRDVAIRRGATGVPVLTEALVHVECQIDNEVSAGDHTIVVGRVLAVGKNVEAEPLIFYRGRYSPEVRGEGEAHRA
jgi:flavin reductase (DIM6/NTAB) family NADH-FMN oxidoreductase RutF